MKPRFDIGLLVDWHGGNGYIYIKKQDVALTTMALYRYTVKTTERVLHEGHPTCVLLLKPWS
jgi:hypothetical protein